MPGLQTDQPEVPEAFLPALVKDLQAHRGRSLVIAGPYQPPAVHALAHAMNQALGNIGPGLGPIIGPAGNYASLPDGAKWLLAIAMMIGRLELLTVLVLFSPTFWRG